MSARIHFVPLMSANRRKDKVRDVLASVASAPVMTYTKLRPHATLTRVISTHKRMACSLGYWGTTSTHGTRVLYCSLHGPLKSMKYCVSFVCYLATSVAVRVGNSYEQEQNMAARDAGILVSFLCGFLVG